MRLINCHIENFGKLKDYDRDFTAGCNSIMASNGQGKSTLAAFIRVMFYGFEGEGKRGAVSNERKRYEPWQGGVYGGRLTFNDGNDTYVIIRTFGSKSADDTFELRAASTNLKSDAYSENVGEELFGVNAESYMRTAYIGQNDVVTHTTDGINAMIGGIADNTGDMESFDKAVTRLNDLLNKESPSRSTGSLYKLKDEVTALHTRVRDGSVIVDSIHRLEDSMGTRQAELKELTERRTVLMKKQKEISAYKDKQALKDKWETVRSEYAERCEEADVRRTAFPGEVPDEETLNTMQDEATEYGRLCESVSFHKLNAEEEGKLKDYERAFAAGLPDLNDTAELLRRIREHDRSLADETGKKVELKSLKKELDSAKSSGRTLPTGAIVGMVLILAAMIGAVGSILIMPSNILRWVGVGVSGLILIGGIVLTLLALKRQRGDMQALIEDIEAEIEDAERDIEEGVSYRRNVMEQVEGYLKRFGMPLDPLSVADDLRRLNVMGDEYNRLKSKLSDHDKAVTERDKCKLKLDKYLSSLSMAPPEDYGKQIGRLSMDLRSLNEAITRRKGSERKLEAFKEEYDVEELEKSALPEDISSLSEIGEELAELDHRIEEITGHIRDDSRQHDALQEKLELFEEDKVALADKEQALVDGKHRYANLKNAAKYLNMAKENITAKYMDPLLTGFSKYYSAVTGSDAGRYHIDANTNITVDELGIQRDTALLSTGYQDLIGFCLRLSLIDAMYEGEKPVLVLDDPFVNLDTERLSGARRLLDTLAQDYQLIYFTCR